MDFPIVYPRTSRTNPTTRRMWKSLLALIVVVGLGIALSLGAMRAAASFDPDRSALAPQVLELLVSTSVNEESVRAGSPLTYTIRYTNATNASISGIIISDTLSFSQIFDGGYQSTPNLPLANYSYTGSPENGYHMIWTLPSLAAHASGTIVLRTSVITGTEPRANLPILFLGNAVEIDAPGHVGQVDDAVSILTGPVLTISKATPLANVYPGRLAVYNITVSNLSRIDSRPATAINVYDILPEQSTFYAASNGGHLSGGYVAWNLPGPLNPGATQVLTFSVRLDPDAVPGTKITNIQTEYRVDAAEMLLKTEAWKVYGLTKADITVASPIEKVGVSPVMWFGKPDVYPGDLITYTISVYNPFTTTLSGLVVTDTLPYDINGHFFEFVRTANGSPAPELALGGSVLVWRNVSIPGWGVTTLSFVARVPMQIYITDNQNNRMYYNTVSAYHPLIAFEKQDKLAVARVKAAVTMNKIVAPSHGQVGDLVAYTITLKSWVNFPVTNLYITDTLEGDFTYSSMKLGPDPLPAFRGKTVVWHFNQLNPNQVVTLAFYARIDGQWLMKYNNNLAGLGSVYVPSRTRLAQVMVDPPIAIEKTVSPIATFVNTSVNYAITLTNQSTVPWTINKITDILPSGFFQVGGSNGNPAVINISPAYVINPGAFWRGNFQANVSTDINCSILPKTFNNEKENIKINIIAPVPAVASNATALAPLLVQPNLQVDLIPYRKVVVPGGTFTYTLKMVNISPADVESAVLNIGLPVGFSYMSTLTGPAPTEINGGVLTWRNIDVAAHTSSEIVFMVMVGPTVPFNKYTPTFSGSAFGVCIGKLGTAGDSLGKGEVEVREEVVLISKEPVVDNAQVPPLALTDFYIYILNRDAYPITIDYITDTLSNGWTYFGMVSGPEPTTIDGNHVVWENVTIPANKKVTWRIRLQSGPLYQIFVNQLTAYSHETLIRPAIGVPGVPVLPLFDLFKDAGTSTVVPGAHIPYTVTLTNWGSSEFAAVAITDTLPAGFSYSRMLAGPIPSSITPDKRIVVWRNIKVTAKGTANSTKTIVFEVVVGNNVSAGVYLNRIQGYSASGSVPGPIDTAPVTVTGNINPVAVNDVATTTEDHSVLINVLSNDTDPDGVGPNPLTVSAVGTASHGTVTRTSTNVTYVPALNYYGPDTFTYTASDVNGGTSDASVTVTVSPVNDAPVAVNDAASPEQGVMVSIPVLANDTDVENNPLSITGVTVPLHGSAVINGSNVQYTSDAAYSGSDAFNYTISDGQGGVATGHVAVTVHTNNLPPTPVNDTATTPEDTQVTISVLSNDTDPEASALTVVSVGTPSHGLASTNGTTVVYTPNLNYAGADSFTYTVSDSSGGTASAAVAITVTPVNDPPVANNDAAGTPRNQAVNIAVLNNDTDPDGDALIISQVSVPQHGTAAINGSTVLYTPASNYTGADSFTYTASDGSGGTDTATVTLDVRADNAAPVANNDSATTNEDTAVLINVLTNDNDPDGDVLSVTGFTAPAHGAVTQSGSTLTYTPAPNYNGADSFTYTASDLIAQDTATVNITVVSVNDPPVANDDAAGTVRNQAVTIPVLGNDTDADGNTLTISVVGAPSHGTAAKSGTAIRYTPTNNYTGADSFTYTVTDGSGGTDSATVTLDVRSSNVAPVAVNDTAATLEDTPVLIDVLGNDTDADADPLSISTFSIPAHGSLALTSGKLTYTPDANYTGSDSFTYTASDLIAEDLASVVVTITPVNDPPTANNDSASTGLAALVSIPVLANDTDLDGDTLSIQAVTNPGHGTAVVSGTSVNYTPQAGFSGTDSFSYTASDGNGGTDTANVVVQVSENPNQPPTPANDAATTPEDTQVVITVLANDTDPEDSALTVVSVGTPSHGLATTNGTTVTYTPALNFTGSDSFIYSVRDDLGGTAQATIVVTVTPVNDPPVANDDAASTGPAAAITIPVIANDTDPDGDTLTIQSVTTPGNGATVIVGASIRYTPQAGFTGTDSFSYTAADGHGGTDTAFVEVSVLNFSLTKVASVSQVTAGGTLVYTITLTNSGPTAYTQVSLTDTLPDGFTFVAMQPGSPAPASTAAGQIIWNGLSVPANGGTLVLAFEVQVNAQAAAGMYLNNVAVSSPSGPTPAPFDTAPVQVLAQPAKKYIFLPVVKK